MTLTTDTPEQTLRDDAPDILLIETDLGPAGPKGDRGPSGIVGAILPITYDAQTQVVAARIFISTTAPLNPQVNDIWIDLSA